MIIAQLSEITPIEILIEKSLRDTGNSRKRYPRSKFKYINYQADPKPDVLILGTWYNKNSKNELLAGINLNYLSDAQIIKLQQSLKKIYGHRTLRSRYRAIKRLLPDVAKYYRTYNQKYIRAITSSEMTSYKRDEPIDRNEPDRNYDKTAWTVKKRVDKAQDKLDKKQDKVQPLAKTLNAKEKEDKEIIDKELAKRIEQEKEQYVELTKKANIERAVNAMDKNSYELDNINDDEIEKDLDEPEDNIDELDRDPYEYDEITDVDDVDDEVKTEEVTQYYLPHFGYVWPSKTSYITHHTMPLFDNLRKSGNRFKVIINVKNDAILIDDADSFEHMLVESGWDYKHVITIDCNDNYCVSYECCDEVANAALDKFMISAEYYYMKSHQN